MCASRSTGKKWLPARNRLLTGLSWSPRLSVRYELKKNTFLKAGYARSTQYLHLLSNTASPTPVDLYFPSTNNIKPSVTDQVSAGLVTIPESLPLRIFC